jgi:hypothetical protein
LYKGTKFLGPFFIAAWKLVGCWAY